MSGSSLLFGEKPLNIDKPWNRMAINSSPRDIQLNELIIRSSFMLFASLNAFIAAPIVTAVCIFRGHGYYSLNPFSYFIIMGPLLIFYTNEEGHYHKIIKVHQVLIFVLPILLQYQCGGLVKSGAMMLGSMLCPLGAAFFSTRKVAIRWFVIYVIVFFILFFVEYNYYTTASIRFISGNDNGTSGGHSNGNNIDDELILSPLECVFFFMNIGGVLFITSSVALMFKTRLDRELEKSEQLIDNVLPRSIAKRLKEGESHIVENLDGITILFADLVGFTSAAAVTQPSFLIGTFLRDVFSAWEQLLMLRNIDKIKTIGDAFMAVGGIEESQARASARASAREEGAGDDDSPPSNQHDSDSEENSDMDSDSDSDSDDHSSSQTRRCAKEVTVEMILLALEMQQALDGINRHYNVNFKCRIGIHSGPVIAGVIGMNKFSFDVWGDAVNTASRMESHGIPGYLQLSSHTYKEIKDLISSLGIDVICRGRIQVKGKGKMKTYLIQMSEDEGDESEAPDVGAGAGARARAARRRRPITTTLNVSPTGDISSAEK